MPTDAAVMQWLAQFAQVSESREVLDQLVTVVDDEITAALPMFTDPTLRRDLDASTRSNWKGFLAVATHDVVDVRPAPEIYDLARTLARRGFELPVLLAVYRIGQRSAWQFITETRIAGIADAGLRSAVLMQLWPRLANWLDTMVEALILTFADERISGSAVRAPGAPKRSEPSSRARPSTSTPPSPRCRIHCANSTRHSWCGSTSMRPTPTCNDCSMPRPSPSAPLSAATGR